MAREIRYVWDALDTEHNRAAVYAWVTDDIKSLVALGCRGGQFALYAASRLLSIRQCWSDVGFWMLVSSLNRGDQRTALIYLDDWVKRK